MTAFSVLYKHINTCCIPFHGLIIIACTPGQLKFNLFQQNDLQSFNSDYSSFRHFNSLLLGQGLLLKKCAVMLGGETVISKRI